jgi:hypothetical protein
MSSPSPVPPALPPRPERRACASRGATFCFWTVLVLFIAALVYIGLLAFASKTGSLPSTAMFNGDLFSGCILACCTIAAVAGCIATRNHRHHQRH